MMEEKILRGILRSEVDRSVSKENIIVVDSLNNIKGYRYELWCLARDLVLDIVLEWNRKRQQEGENSYEDKILEGPDRCDCWDSPLFELHPSTDEITPSATAITEAIPYVTKNADLKSIEVRILQLTIDTQNRQIGLPELRSLRQTFIKLTWQYSLSRPPPPSGAVSAKRMFVDYLNRDIGTS